MARVPVRRIPRGSLPKVHLLDLWRWIKWILLLILIGVGVKTAVYTIDTDSAGVVKRFGKYNRTTDPGIHLMMPFGIEKVHEVPVTRNQK